MPRYFTLTAALFATLCFLLPTAGRADELADANRLFSFAESRYSQYFAPADRDTVTYQGYLVRYYPDTKTYLGVLAGGVYVYSKALGEGIKYVGDLFDFITP